MAKNKATLETETTEAPETVKDEAPKVDKRQKTIITPAGDVVKRTAYIRELWAGCEMTRSQIRDHLVKECTSEDGSNNIAYQIVFAATKGAEGGPSEEELASRKQAKEDAKKEAADAKAKEKAEAKAALTPPAEPAEE